jgi:hypothetical protein
MRPPCNNKANLSKLHALVQVAYVLGGQDGIIAGPSANVEVTFCCLSHVSS